MYTPPHFAQTDTDALAALIDRHSFGTLISVVDGRPFATHLPFLYERQESILLAHMARANPHWKALSATDAEALVVFRGPHAYVSPSWYLDPGVPTWNYTAAHVYGRFITIDDPLAHRALLAALTDRFESDRDNAWRADFDGPPAAGMVRGTVAFRIEISEIIGKAKLSQNRSASDRERVIRHLEANQRDDDKEIAALMRN